MSTPRSAQPTGFWEVPSEVWDDEQVMDDFAQRVFDHMTAASGTNEARDEVEEVDEGP